MAGKKPNFEKYENSIREETEALERLELRIKECDESIKSHDGGREKYLGSRDEQRKNIEEIQAQIEQQMKAKSGIQNSIEEHNKRGKEMKNKIADMKRNKKIVYTSEEEINATIKEIEQQMMISTLSTKEEKDCIQKISDLKKSKPLVSTLKSMNSEASTDASSIEPLRLKRNEAQETLAKLIELRKAETEKLKNIIESWNQANAPVRALIEQKSELFQQIKDHKSKRYELHKELSAEKRKFADQEREQRRARAEKIRDEKAKRAQQDAIEKLKVHLEKSQAMPYSQALTDAKQAHHYLKRQQHILGGTGVDETAVAGDTKAEPVASMAVDGEEIIMPKKDRTEEIYLAPKGKGGKKGKTKKAEPSKKSKPLAHEIRAIADFTRMGFPLPLTVDEIPASLDAIQKKINELEGEHSKALEKWKSSLEVTEKKLNALESGIPWEEAVATTSKNAEVTPKEGDDIQDGNVTAVTPVAAVTGVTPEADETEAGLQKTETGSTKSEKGTPKDEKEVSPDATPATDDVTATDEVPEQQTSEEGPIKDTSDEKNEFQEEIPEGSEFQEEIPEGGEFQEDVPEGGEEVPKGGEFEEEVPKGGEIEKEICEGGEFQEEVPKGGEFEEEVPKGGEFEEEVPKEGEFKEEIPEGGPSQTTSNEKNELKEQDNTTSPTVEMHQRDGADKGEQTSSDSSEESSDTSSDA